MTQIQLIRNDDTLATLFIMLLISFGVVAYFSTGELTAFLLVLSPLLLIAGIVVLIYVFTAIIVLGAFLTAVVMKLLE